jgi:2-polyprenyl-3-methyl-5-hydroxy-6-metoxy-1,4-benzoquinol methylase
MQDFPRPEYDVIVWFEGIEHLHLSEYRAVITRIRQSLGHQGILIGSTPLVNKEQQGKGNWEHHHEFSSVGELTEFLTQDFAKVEIYTTLYPSLGGGKRHTAYFVLQEPYINA